MIAQEKCIFKIAEWGRWAGIYRAAQTTDSHLYLPNAVSKVLSCIYFKTAYYKHCKPQRGLLSFEATVLLTSLLKPNRSLTPLYFTSALSPRGQVKVTTSRDSAQTNYSCSVPAVHQVPWKDRAHARLTAPFPRRGKRTGPSRSHLTNSASHHHRAKWRQQRGQDGNGRASRQRS